MKILISDYSSDYSTEPLYLNTIFNQIGCKSTLLSNDVSVFDSFDTCEPDIYITHHSILSKDLLVYLASATRKIDLAINITGISQDDLSKMDSIFSSNNIVPSMYFVNRYDHSLFSRNKITTILHGADLFLSSEAKQYDIEYGIFVDDASQIKLLDSTYHYITYLKTAEKDADIFLPVHRLTHMYHNYKHIVFKYFHNIFPQAFFDAAVRSGSVLFDLSDRSALQSNLSKLFGDENYCDFANTSTGSIKDKVLGKHTCFHRAKSLLSQFPAKEHIDNLQKIIESKVIA
jgi:hypothetical protein